MESMRSALVKDTVVAVSTSGAAKLRGLSRFKQLILTLAVESAERDSTDETYDIYVTTQGAGSRWDLVHFPQIVSTGAKTYVARVLSELLPQNVSTAGPGVPVVDSATVKTDTAGADQGVKTLGAGLVRHGPWGDVLGYEVVVGGTVVTGIKLSLYVEAIP